MHIECSHRKAIISQEWHMWLLTFIINDADRKALEYVKGRNRNKI
jgi:hypothetical protein